jgi:hypothetical protein
MDRFLSESEIGDRRKTTIGGRLEFYTALVARPHGLGRQLRFSWNSVNHESHSFELAFEFLKGES